MSKSKKKLQISKRTILISIFSLLLIAAPLIYYFMSKEDQGDVLSWYSSSWGYRRSITVENGTGSTLSNEDVLVTVDTQTLISEGKLQSDCGDLRFVDSDDTTVLSYWIESGCNSSTTEVWVRIPSLPSGGEIIYLYYSNSSVINGEESWSGNFYLFSNEASCGTGWSADTSFDSMYVYGSSSANQTKSGSHYHLYNGTISTSDITGTVGIWSEHAVNFCDQTQAIHQHSHEYEIELLSETNLPPYYNALVCSSNDLIIDNKIAIFDSSVPTNWTRFSALDSRYIRGSSSAGGTGGSFSHTHSTFFQTTGITLDSGAFLMQDVECEGTTTSLPEYNDTHGHGAGGLSASTPSAIPPYIRVIFAESNGSQRATGGMITGSSSLPPLGWNIHNDLDNDRLLFGYTSFGGTGGTTTHTHQVSGNTGTPTSSVSGEANTGTQYYAPTTSHTHSINKTVGANTNWPNSRSLLFIQRKTSLASTVGAEETPNLAPSTPSSLLTEGQTNPVNVTDTTPEFSAIFNDSDSGDTSSFYEIEVNTTSGFTGTVMWDSGKSSMTSTTEGTRSPNISYAGSGLNYNVTYYWRIKFWDTADAESPWSSTASFKLNRTPTSPSSLLTEGQTDPNSITDTTPEFSGIFNDPDSTDTSSYYEIEVNTSSAYTGTVMWDSGKTSMTSTSEGTRSPDISYAGSALNYNTTYYWRVKFWDSVNNESPWSSTANFKLNRTPTSPTSLLTEGQSNPTAIKDTTPEFSAIFDDPDSTDTSSYYEIEVNTSSEFTGTVMWDSGKSSMTTINQGERSPNILYTGDTLNPETTYYWRIKFWDSVDNESSWSITSDFNIDFNPSATSLLTVGETNPSIVLFDIYFSSIYTDPNGDNSSAYQIQVNTASNFAGITMWDSNKTSITISSGNRSSNIYYNGNTLSYNGTTYYVRMRFWDIDDNVSEWTTGQFTDTLKRFQLDGLLMDGIRLD